MSVTKAGRTVAYTDTDSIFAMFDRDVVGETHGGVT